MKTDGNVQVRVDVECLERINEVFIKMAEGGTVHMELQDAFWGSGFGILEDKFGVSWMFNHPKKRDG